MLSSKQMEDTRSHRVRLFTSRALHCALRTGLRLIAVAILGCIVLGAAEKTTPDISGNWPQWRGPLASGVSPDANPPVEWSEERNVRWKLPVPGKGRSTPIVWGDRVFLSAAVPFGKAVAPVYDNAPGTHDNLGVTQHHRFVLMAVSRLDGKIAWSRTVREDFPHEGGHETGSLASNSPVTDGELLFASFGSRGLYCFDLNGKLKW